LWCGATAFATDTVTLYYWGSETDTLALDQIQDFESLHDGRDGTPAMKVIMGQSATINKTDDPQRLLTAVAGGGPPDVVWYDRFAVGEWAARGAFQSLQPFLEEDWKERPDDPFTFYPEQFYPPCWAEANYNGELYAVPADTDNRALYYNQDILEKYAAQLIPIGCVDPNDPTKVGPPRTWDQLKQCARIMTEYDNGRLEKVGFIPNFGNSWLYIYGWLNGGNFMSEDGRTCTLNSPEIVEALAYMTEVYDIMGGAEAVIAFQSALQTGDLDPFLSGRVAMKIDGDPFINNIANLKRDMRFGIALAPAPEGKPQLGWCGGWCWVIPRGASHPREAWEFVKYMASKRAYKIRTDGLRQAQLAAGNVLIPQISARRDITEWAMEYYLYDDPSIESKFKVAKRTFVEAMPISKYRPVTPVGQLLWTEQVRSLDNGIFKKFDKTDIRRNAQQALDISAARVQAELDRIHNPKPYPVLKWWPIVAAYIVMLGTGIVFAYRHFGRKMQAHGYFRKEFYAGYAFVTPWVVGFLVFGGGPIVFSLFMSFCEYDVLSPPKFVGFRNFVTMFVRDPLFYKSLGNTMFMALGIPLGMAVSLGIAMLLSYEIKGMAVYRTFYYLPAIMPAVAASILWIWIFNPHQGILNTTLVKIGISGPAWLQNEHWSKPALILMGLWGAGSGMIVWLAGLKGIPKHLYEAAEIDGADRWRKFWNVTVPMLSPYILFNLIMGLIGTFQIFTQAFIMTQGGPVDSTLFYAYNLFNNAFRYMKMGYASALAWVLFGIILVLTVLQLRISKLWVYYESDS
jgi:multiple sugar transport system permease protein